MPPKKQNPILSLIDKVRSLGKETYVRQPDPTPQVPPERIIEALHILESSQGKAPNTPRNQQRTYTIPPANQNEKPRNITYDVGYGGEFGLTPVALGQLTKSKIDKTSKQNKYGYTGFIPGQSPEEIQRALSTSTTTAGGLASQLFIDSKASSTDFRPETLADDYLNMYVTKGSPNYNEKNRQRALKVFKELVGGATSTTN